MATRQAFWYPPDDFAAGKAEASAIWDQMLLCMASDVASGAKLIPTEILSMNGRILSGVSGGVWDLL